MRFLLVLVVLSAAPARAEVYEVGPGMPYAAVGDVPLESLVAGDEVRIHWRDTPYQEKWVAGGAGSEAAPIVFRGVAGPGGVRPIIDGNGATTRLALNYWNEDRMVVKVGGSSVPPSAPSWIVIEGLDIRNAAPGASFTDEAGAAGVYAGNAAAVLVEDGDHVTLRDCVLTGSANGLFAQSAASDVLIEGNYIHGNGAVGDIYVHNSYTEAMRITFQYNHYGPLCAGCDGNNLKDRSAGTVVRYNWIEGGNRQLDLVDSDTFAGDPAYATTWVYGNVLVEREGDGNRQIVHYGGDSGDETLYRKGTLYFLHNTVVSTRTSLTTLMRLSSPGESAHAHNNILYVSASGDSLAMLDGDGALTMASNWLKPGWVDAHGGLAGTIMQALPQVEGAAPGFVDEGAQDFHLLDVAAARDQGTALPAGAPPVTMQYVMHQRGEPRPLDGPADLGAYEFCQGACAGVPDAGPPAGDDAGGPGAADAAVPAGADGGGGGGAGGGCGCRAGGRGVTWPGFLAGVVVWLWFARRRSRDRDMMSR